MDDSTRMCHPLRSNQRINMTKSERVIGCDSFKIEKRLGLHAELRLHSNEIRIDSRLRLD